MGRMFFGTSSESKRTAVNDFKCTAKDTVAAVIGMSESDNIMPFKMKETVKSKSSFQSTFKK